MKEGFAYVVKQPFILKSMILAALFNLILSPLFLVGGPIILRVSQCRIDLYSRWRCGGFKWNYTNALLIQALPKNYCDGDG